MDDVKSLILDKAKERFDRFGFKKTTMDEISRDCKISKKTVYEHFDDKEALFTSLFVRECRLAQDAILARMGRIDDPLQRLIQLFQTSIGYFREDNFLTRLLKDDDALFSAFLSTKYHAIVAEDILDLIAATIREGKEQGRLRDVDEEVVAYAGLKLFQAFSYMRTMPFCQEKDDQGYYTAAVIDFMINGMANPEGKVVVSGSQDD